MAASSLQIPPLLAPNAMRVVARRIGRCRSQHAVVEFDGQMLLIDCGVLFPEDDHPGVDLILPGFDAISERLQDVPAGAHPRARGPHRRCAVPAATATDIPLIGSKLTLALLAEKLREHHLRNVSRAS